MKSCRQMPATQYEPFGTWPSTLATLTTRRNVIPAVLPGKYGVSRKTQLHPLPLMHIIS